MAEKSKFITEERAKFNALIAAEREKLHQEERDRERVQREVFEKSLEGKTIEDKEEYLLKLIEKGGIFPPFNLIK